MAYGVFPSLRSSTAIRGFEHTGYLSRTTSGGEKKARAGAVTPISPRPNLLGGARIILRCSFVIVQATKAAMRNHSVSLANKRLGGRPRQRVLKHRNRVIAAIAALNMWPAMVAAEATAFFDAIPTSGPAPLCTAAR